MFPECIHSGYGYESRAEVLRAAESLPGPGTDTIALTVEPAGGVPQPTGDIVLAGTLTA